MGSAAHGDFDDFDGVHHQQAQLSIEGVVLPDEFEGRSRAKAVVVLTKWERISRETPNALGRAFPRYTGAFQP